MATKYIYMSTTDIIPSRRNEVVTKSELTWSEGSKSMKEAYDSIEDWTRRNGYDAIIGVQFIVGAIPYVGFQYSVFGTAIAWAS